MWGLVNDLWPRDCTVLQGLNDSINHFLWSCLDSISITHHTEYTVTEDAAGVKIHACMKNSVLLRSKM